MSWNMTEAITWYKTQGAPGDQSALLSLLKEVQAEFGGSIPSAAIKLLAQGLEVRETYLVAVIRRFPSLHMGGEHCLELCAGPNCGRHSTLAEAAEKFRSAGVLVKAVPCMRMCGKGPNLRWDGRVCHGATTELLERLMEIGVSDAECKK